MSRPQGNGLQKAKKKLERLAVRGARPRRLRRMASRVERLRDDYERRVAAWRAER